ncbi:MAG: hypothetical protein RL518_222 [Pseudomonadota bacterium]|jgi:hypothetical protein
MEAYLQRDNRRSGSTLRLLLSSLLTLCVAASPLVACAEVLLAQDEAMEAAFGADTQITSRTKKIPSEQKLRIEEIAQTTLTSSFLHYYEGRRNGELLGYAVIDSRVMRTNLAVFMVVVSPDLVVQKVILLAFHEPSEYQPTDAWLKLLEGSRPMQDLVPGQGLAPIAGSTLTVNGLSDGVRAVRASFEVLLKEAK